MRRAGGGEERRRVLSTNPSEEERKYGKREGGREGGRAPTPEVRMTDWNRSNTGLQAMVASMQLWGASHSQERACTELHNLYVVPEVQDWVVYGRGALIKGFDDHTEP